LVGYTLSPACSYSAVSFWLLAQRAKTIPSICLCRFRIICLPNHCKPDSCEIGKIQKALPTRRVDPAGVIDKTVRVHILQRITTRTVGNGDVLTLLWTTSALCQSTAGKRRGLN
jgi:hypothetical protein